MLFSYLKGDFLKTKRLSIRTAHLFIPVVTAAVFIAYYTYSPWDSLAKVDAYYQVLGIGLPFLIGLFSSVLSEQEQSSGHFQAMLTAASKEVPFLSKLVLLLLFGAASLFAAAMLFGTAFQFWLRDASTGFVFHLLAALVLLGSSVPLYLLHLFLSFRLDKGVSIGLGIVESVLSALFLTGLGDLLWKYVPSVWPARMVSTFLRAYCGNTNALEEFRKAGIFALFVTAIGLAAYLLWARGWEGRRTVD